MVCEKGVHQSELVVLFKVILFTRLSLHKREVVRIRVASFGNSTVKMLHTFCLGMLYDALLEVGTHALDGVLHL